MSQKDKNISDKKETLEKRGKINWEKKAGEYLDGWKRAKADYLNLQKETKQGQQQIVQFAHVLIISELLPIIDNFKKAVKHLEDRDNHNDKSCLDGFGHIEKQFEDFLKKSGVTSIKTDNADFDPTFHEAIERKDSAKIKSGKIIKEVEAGYMINGKLLRPAKVIVAK